MTAPQSPVGVDEAGRSLVRIHIMDAQGKYADGEAGEGEGAEENPKNNVLHTAILRVGRGWKADRDGVCAAFGWGQ